MKIFCEGDSEMVKSSGAKCTIMVLKNTNYSVRGVSIEDSTCGYGKGMEGIYVKK